MPAKRNWSTGNFDLKLLFWARLVAIKLPAAINFGLGLLGLGFGLIELGRLPEARGLVSNGAFYLWIGSLLYSAEMRVRCLARLVEAERIKHRSWLGESNVDQTSWQRGSDRLSELVRPLAGPDLWLYSMAMTAGIILTRSELTFANVRVLSGIVVVCLGLTVVTQEYLSRRTAECCQPSPSNTSDVKSSK